ncbi:putative outer membrane protein, partial [Salmonella enterica subsp. enterica serovar Enteritidis str. 561362 1-1]
DRHSDNAGFEGLARGRGEHALMVAQEKKPLRLYVTDRSPDALSVSDSLTHRASLPWFLKDISGLHYDRNNGLLYVLSHESAVVVVSGPGRREESDVAAPGTLRPAKGYSPGGGDSLR